LIIHDIGNEERKIDEEEGVEEENEEKGNCSSMVKMMKRKVKMFLKRLLKQI